MTSDSIRKCSHDTLSAYINSTRSKLDKIQMVIRDFIDFILKDIVFEGVFDEDIIYEAMSHEIDEFMKLMTVYYSRNINREARSDIEGIYKFIFNLHDTTLQYLQIYIYEGGSKNKDISRLLVNPAGNGIGKYFKDRCLGG